MRALDRSARRCDGKLYGMPGGFSRYPRERNYNTGSRRLPEPRWGCCYRSLNPAGVAGIVNIVLLLSGVLLDFRLILLLCFGAAFLNLPFGYYRAGVRKFSWQWFLAVHLPVPLIFVTRIESDVGWSAIPLLIAAAVAGQLMGGIIRPGVRNRHTAKEILVEKDER